MSWQVIISFYHQLFIISSKVEKIITSYCEGTSWMGRVCQHLIATWFNFHAYPTLSVMEPAVRDELNLLAFVACNERWSPNRKLLENHRRQFRIEMYHDESCQQSEPLTFWDRWLSALKFNFRNLWQYCDGIDGSLTKQRRKPVDAIIEVIEFMNAHFFYQKSLMVEPGRSENWIFHRPQLSQILLP